MTASLLIIEDEGQLRRMLRIALSSGGYTVLEADNGERGLAAIVRHKPDLVILDLGLPDKDGHQILNELRAWSSTPVIILSARDGDREKVRALDGGAQDYVNKPFSVEELLARIRATLRDRRKQGIPPVLDDGYLCIDLVRRLVTVAGATVDLTPKEYAVLSKLARSPNCVITQTQLLQEVWGPSHQDNTHYLRIVISHLRQKLGEDPAEPKYFRTEVGVGYRLLFRDDGQGRTV